MWSRRILRSLPVLPLEAAVEVEAWTDDMMRRWWGQEMVLANLECGLMRRKRGKKGLLRKTRQEEGEKSNSQAVGPGGDVRINFWDLVISRRSRPRSIHFTIFMFQTLSTTMLAQAIEPASNRYVVYGCKQYRYK